MKVTSYRDLEVWQRSMELAFDVYKVSRSFPREEMYGLTSQIRRASVSVPCNIAEGHGRSSTRDFLRMLSISRGSLGEVETQLILSNRLGYLSSESLDRLLQESDEISRMLRGLQKALLRRDERRG